MSATIDPVTSRTLSRRAFACASATASIAGLLALAGCSSNGGSSTSTSSTSASTSTASTSTADGGTADAGDLGLVEQGKLSIGSDCDYPPFIQLDGEQPSGFEYDLLSAVSKRMGLEVNFLAPQKFDTLIASIATGGKFDLAVSSITITDERKETVDFCDPYFDSNQSVTVMKDSGISSTDDLATANVAAQSGTTGEAWIKENLTGATLTPFDDASSAFAALAAGKVDAVVLDLPVAVDMVKNAYSDAQIIDEIATGEQYGFAVSKDNPALKEAVNKALAAVREDGEYQDIYDSYFKVSK